MSKSKMKYVGVDGCTGGWLAVGLDDGVGWEVKGFFEFVDLMSYFANADLILVDMPIGLNPDTQHPIRPCDTKARRVLNRNGGRGQSVFPPPNRVLADAAMTGEVIWLNRRVVMQHNQEPVGHVWAKVNMQTFQISAATGEVNSVLRGRGNRERPFIREVHPEVCFRLLGEERVIQFPKQTTEGTMERLEALRGYEPLTDEIFTQASAKFRNNPAADNHDILDALVAAVTAKLGCWNQQYQLYRLPGNECVIWNAPANGWEMLYVARRPNV